VLVEPSIFDGDDRPAPDAGGKSAAGQLVSLEHARARAENVALGTFEGQRAFVVASTWKGLRRIGKVAML